MNLETIKTVLQNKITALNTRREHHFKQGDLDLVVSLDLEIDETQTTLNEISSKQPTVE